MTLVQKTSAPILKRRNPRLLRDDPPQPRDIDIVRSVYQYRAMSRDQIEKLYFGPNSPFYKASKYSRKQPYPEKIGATSERDTGCKRRLRWLYDRGYLFRDDQPQRITEGRKPLVYFLDTAGARLLAEFDEVDLASIDWHKRENDVSWLFLNHLLATNDVRLAVTLAARQHGYQITSWLDDRSLRRDRREYVSVQVAYRDGQGRDRIREEKVAFVPDGYFTIEAEGKMLHYFLETDMGTVTGISQREGRRDFSRKVKAYMAYRASGKFKERYGADTFRVLTVTTSEQRMANLVQATHKAQGKFTFFFSTFERIKGGDLLTDLLWNQPGTDEQKRLILPQPEPSRLQIP